MITLLLLVRAAYIYGCCSSPTSRSWWTAHSTKRERRGCNNNIGLRRRWTTVKLRGGLSVSAIFCSKFQRVSRQVLSLSPTIPTVLTRRSSPPLSVVRCTKRMLSQILSALKPKGSIGDEHSMVTRKTL